MRIICTPYLPHTDPSESLPSPGFFLPARATHTHALPSQLSDNSFETSLSVTGPQLPWACLPPRSDQVLLLLAQPSLPAGPSLPLPPHAWVCPPLCFLGASRLQQTPTARGHPVFLCCLHRLRSLEAAHSSCPQRAGPLPSPLTFLGAQTWKCLGSYTTPQKRTR